MKKLFSLLTRFKWRITTAILFASVLFIYNTYLTTSATDSTPSFFVVSEVSTGEVTSGIEASGEIIAAQKLDLDVYKQLSRIDTVNVTNGSHVVAGDVLVSFDKNDAYVEVQSSAVAVAEARLSLDEAKKSAVDPNTAIATLKNQIENYTKIINESEQDKKDALINYLNADLEINPSDSRYSQQNDRAYPTLSGRYESTATGVYTISIYASGADSGFTYRVSGLESATGAVLLNKAQDIGNRGLKILFPTDTQTGDTWVIALPNITSASYEKNKADYQQALADIEKSVRDASVMLANAKTELATLERTDTNTYRDLAVSKASATLSEAQQKLSNTYDVVQEMNIIAPFAGSIEGMENVVSGATPTGGESDTISLGTLISDEFLTTFTLGAADVAKVKVGQRVKVTVTSFSEQPTFEATITEISSLPETSGVAQYEVRALLIYDRSTAKNILREGMLADIEVVQEEKANAVRVPTNAITYEQGTPKVSILENLTADQQAQVAKMGIIKTEGTTLPTYQKTVELGIVGQYYVEIINGLNEGDLIVTTSQTANASESVVEQSGFGPGRNSSNQQPPSQPSN